MEKFILRSITTLFQRREVIYSGPLMEALTTPRRRPVRLTNWTRSCAFHVGSKILSHHWKCLSNSLIGEKVRSGNGFPPVSIIETRHIVMEDLAIQQLSRERILKENILSKPDRFYTTNSTRQTWNIDRTKTSEMI
jgi:hypothetical protein